MQHVLLSQLPGVARSWDSQAPASARLVVSFYYSGLRRKFTSHYPNRQMLNPCDRPSGADGEFVCGGKAKRSPSAETRIARCHATSGAELKHRAGAWPPIPTSISAI